MRILQPAKRAAKSKPRAAQAESAQAESKWSESTAPLADSGSEVSEFNSRSAKPNRRERNKANVTAQASGHVVGSEANIDIADLPPGKKRRRSELQHAATPSSSEPLALVVDPAKKEFNELFARGVRLLAMREHSVKEITNKLLDKSDKSDLVHAVVDELLSNKYLSDERFTESYIRARGSRGFGPVKIRSELKVKGVNSTLIQEHLIESSVFWLDIATTQYQKKYGDAPVSDYNAWTKRARFMQSRGFTMEHIHITLPSVEFD